ncbi:glycerol-3-phosphate acyltransferase [Salirhabdus salicampi]|uniref:glycerol-3-phosphate acyltransferase n=1 Tax=Salirhabdus salicampi TaxID=476102 RepID=UPI0020C55BB4|nr:glycerol-3-phosphate acyltransferase [Salirhabdus salicampi]MCP8615801.1 glycerol-3-phosphate acyltransferase [Salirhabdus salicampi]
MSYIFMAMVIGYIFGCIQPSYIVSKWKGKDIRYEGSKNAGASNVTIIFGWKFGLMVALIDILKPILAMAIMVLFIGNQVTVSTLQLLYFINGSFVIIGHNYPIHMQFRGGKGTASLIGFIFALNWKIALLGLAIFILAAVMSDYIVIGAFSLYFFLIGYTYFGGYGLYALLITLFITLVAIIKHVENFIRIYNKKEAGLRQFIKHNKIETGA